MCIRDSNRSKLINLSKNNQMLFKEEEIVDKDENGEDRTATMRVKYKVPKKNFDRKLRNLYIKMFERNVPEPLQIESYQNDIFFSDIIDDKDKRERFKDQLDLMKGSPLTMGVIGHPEHKQTDDAAKVYNKRIEEEGEGGCIGGGTTNASSSGQYSQPSFPMNRRTMYGDVDEDTTTTSVGNYQYDVPFCGDKETLARKNGKGGSISINKM
ncbi:MAG: hypothetical protein K2H20_01160, partial [Bacilli bacterium]|nr:hypothetical protein [Bacilli bacterium]